MFLFYSDLHLNISLDSQKDVSVIRERGEGTQKILGVLLLLFLCNILDLAPPSLPLYYTPTPCACMEIYLRDCFHGNITCWSFQKNSVFTEIWQKNWHRRIWREKQVWCHVRKTFYIYIYISFFLFRKWIIEIQGDRKVTSNFTILIILFLIKIIFKK